MTGGIPSAVDQTNLNAAYTQLCQLIASVTANPKPSYSVDGEQYSWAEYLEILNRQLLETEKAIQRASGPFLMTMKMRT